ncbi:PAS domain-containing protein [Halobacteriales archaeon Cl-PHB]
MSERTGAPTWEPNLDPEEVAYVLDELCDVFYVFDEEGTFRYWNETVCNVTGYDDETIATSSPTTFFHHEDAGTVSEAIQEVIDEGRSVTVQARLLPAGSNPVPYEFSSVRLGEDEDGRWLVAGIGRNVADRKTRERKLRQLSEEYETILDHAQDAIYLIDVNDGEPRYTFSRMNPKMARQTAIEPDEIAGETLSDVLGTDIADTGRENFDECIRHLEPVSYEITATRPRPVTIWQSKVAPVVIDDEVTQLVGSARDITRQRSRERELQRQNERLEEFASVVSHDLRNPLAVARARLELATDECDSDHLDAVTDSLDRIDAIVTDTLTLAREGNTVDDREWVDVGIQAHEAWSMVDTLDATLEADTSLRIRADPDRLQRLLENLFRNAAEHGGDVVTATVDRLADGFAIADDGPGISADARDDVFEPGHSTDPDGTGFGLPIVRRIAQAHGWEVELTESEDGGARFAFTGVETAE